MKEIYVITEHWHTGTPYDNYSTETPIRWFYTLDDAIGFCEQYGTELTGDWCSPKFMASYDIRDTYENRDEWVEYRIYKVY